MGENEILVVDHEVPHEEHVHIQRARPPAHPPRPPRIVLELSGHLEQGPRTELRIELDHQVQVRTLPGRAPHRLGLVELRDRHHAREPLHRSGEMGVAVAEVGAKTDEGTHA
jgi:hypothetical protein